MYLLCSECLNNGSSTIAKKSTVFCFSIYNSLDNAVHYFFHSCQSCPHVNSPYPIVNTSTCNKTDRTYDFYSPSVDTSDMNMFWHCRLGHVPFAKMRGMSNIPVSFAPKQPLFCSICPMARQTRLSFPLKITNTTAIFEMLHVDLCGPYHVPTYENFKYFLILAYDYNRLTWTHLLNYKSNAL